MKIKVLGSAAGGGFPQWNCACRNCAGVRSGKIRARRRTQTQLAVCAGDSWYLLDASPDLRTQLESSPELVPTENGTARRSPVSGAFLTRADADSVLGLFSLREFQPLTVYSTLRVRRAALEGNNFFSLLQREEEQLRWLLLSEDQSLELPYGDANDETLKISPVFLQHNAGDPELDQDVIGIELADPGSGKSLLYLPSLPGWSAALLERIGQCDVLLLDGTFWSDDELRSIRCGNGRTARQMGHIPVSGRDGSLATLRGLRCRKMFIHLNNTNPMLDEDSDEYAAASQAGWELAYDGMEMELR